MLKFSVRFLIKLHYFLWSEVQSRLDYFCRIFVLVDSLELEKGLLLNTDIMYLKMRKAECWSENNRIGE